VVLMSTRQTPDVPPIRTAVQPANASTPPQQFALRGGMTARWDLLPAQRAGRRHGSVLLAVAVGFPDLCRTRALRCAGKLNCRSYWRIHSVHLLAFLTVPEWA
jgi:hypothetical protein